MQEFDYTDFLNSKGQGVNFLTGKPYGTAYSKLVPGWSRLIMYRDASIVKDIVESLRDNQITIISAPTGVGKGVTTPKYMLKLMHLMDPSDVRKIAMTIPKRDAAKMAAEYAALTLDVPLGSHVDYAFRGHPASKTARLLYCTDGILLARVLHGDAMLRDYKCIIIDEAHERPLPTDMLLYFLRAALRARPDMRVVVMSATIDPKPYEDYFSGLTVHVVKVPGQQNYPVQQHFLTEPIPNVTQAVGATVQRAAKVVSDTPDGDMIVFVPKVKDAIAGCSKGGPFEARSDTLCLSIFAQQDKEIKDIAVDDQLYKQGTTYTRRILFATNVAESSMTFKGIKYVVDSGLEMAVRWDARRHARTMEVAYITRGQAEQRIGRTGRTGPGEAFQMYTREQFDKLPALPRPKILDADVTDMFLMLLEHHTIRDVVTIFASMLTPPTIDQLVGSLSYLHFNGMVHITQISNGNKSIEFKAMPWKSIASYEDLLKYDGSIMSVGRALLKALDISQAYALLLLWGSVFECQQEMVILACILEVCGGDTNLLWSKDGLRATDLKRIRHPSSDHITLIQAYQRLFLRDPNSPSIHRMTWRDIQTKIQRYYRMNIDDDELKRLRAQATLKGMSPLENALFAARCYNVACIDKQYNLNSKENKKEHNKNGQKGGKLQQRQQQRPYMTQHIKQHQHTRACTVYPLQPTVGTVERVFAPTSVNGLGGVFVFEELVDMGSRVKFNLVTGFPNQKDLHVLACPSTNTKA